MTLTAGEAAVVGERPRPAETQQAGSDRDRFVAFAFAAAELLVETTEEGRIAFAAGAFRAHFGLTDEQLIGTPVERLVLPERRGHLLQALAVLNQRGRIPPMSLPLNNQAATAMMISGLCIPGREGNRHYLTFGPPPNLTAEVPSLHASQTFLRTAEMRLRAAREEGGAEPVLNLIEVKGQAGRNPELDKALGDALVTTIGEEAVTGHLAAGRYGLLHGGGAAPDIAEITARVEATLASRGLGAKLQSSPLPLDAKGLSDSQAVRVLRHALNVFEREGSAGLGPAGLGGGFEGFMEKLTERIDSFRLAVARRQFSLAFQPVCHLRDGRPHHYEALIRPEGMKGAKPDSPQDFVLFAETMGLTEGLDMAVAERTLETLAYAEPSVRVACNISGLSLQSPDFRGKLIRMLEASPSAKRLLVEVTETAEIENDDEAVRTAEQLRALGVPVCLDDFGAGAAAFRYLRTLPTDFVKIDGLYVRNAVENERDRNMLAAMVDLARAVNAKTIAEHVETEVDVAVLRALGIDMGQGWYFGRPSTLPRGRR